jgi:hypothetical protein
MFDEVLEHLPVSNGVNTMVIHCINTIRTCQKESTIVQELSDTPDVAQAFLSLRRRKVFSSNAL